MKPPVFDKALDYLIKRERNYQLIHDDCLNAMDKMDKESVHLIVTDPPYFIDGMDDTWDSDNLNNKKAKAGVVGGLPTGMKFDPKQGRRLQEFFSKVSSTTMRVLMPGSFFLVFSFPRLSHRMAVAMEDQGFEIRDMYAWHYKRSQGKAFSMDHFVKKMKISDSKKNSIIRKLGGRKTAQLKPQFETIIVAQKPREGTLVENWLKWNTGLADLKNTRVNGHTPTTVIEAEKPVKEIYNSHLTVKPVSLIETLIKLFSKEGQTVLDPFMGSGTTLLATRNTGRFGIGIEINKEYYGIAEKRVEL